MHPHKFDLLLKSKLELKLNQYWNLKPTDQQKITNWI